MATATALRLGTRADLESLVRLAVEFRDYLERADPEESAFRERFALLLRDPATELLLAREPSLGDCGYAQCRYRVSAWNGGMEAELEDLFVSGAARRRGIGHRLVAFALERATARGCASVGLTTNERNAEALALYTGFGFSAERRRWNGGRQLWLDLRIDRGPE